MIYIFKTQVASKKSVKTLAPSLSAVNFITKWNFDLSDCDRILRIEANELDTEIVCKLLNSFGFGCTEIL